MRNTVLFLIAFLTIAVVLIATEWRNMPDYQAYQRPPMEMPK
jgi:hypothetical protein